MSVKINAKFVRSRLVQLDSDQKGLAEAAGLTEATVSRLLNGGDFTSRTLGMLAKALDCSPVDLIQTNGYESPLVDAPVAEVGYS